MDDGCGGPAPHPGRAAVRPGLRGEAGPARQSVAVHAPTLFELRPSPPPRRPPARAVSGPGPVVRRGPTLLAVDGDSLGHRSFHGAAAAAAEGDGRGPVHGFLALLAALCERVGPDGVLVGFDCRDGLARRRRYSAYKANRPARDPALTVALASAESTLRELGVSVVVSAGWEADDVLGSAAAAAEAAGWRCVVATSDRDALALIGETTTVLRLRSGSANAVEVDRRALRRELGVDPGQYVQFAALRGDAADNLRGIPGIGRARARALLSAYPTVAAAVADPLGCRSVLGREPGQALLDDCADPSASVFLRNVDLMTVRRDVPVDVAACRPSLDARRVTHLLAGRGLSSVAGRLAAALAARPAWAPPPGDADVPPDD